MNRIIVIPKTSQSFVLIYQDDSDDCLLVGIVGDPHEGRASDMQQHPWRLHDRYHVQELFSSEWVKLGRRDVCNGAGETSEHRLNASSQIQPVT